MTAKQMLPALSARVHVPCGDLRIECRVVDAKHVYGAARVQVSPVTGTGLQWVDVTRVRLIETAKEIA